MNRSVFDPKNSPIGASRESAPSRTPGSAAGDELTVSTMTGPPIDPVETHSAELWTSLAVNRYREGLDIGALIEGRRILLLGDTNHGTLGLQRGLIDLLPGLREHGIEHLALEIPRNLAGGEPNEIAMRTRIPHCELELLDNAAALGFTVHFIDLADDDLLRNDERTVNHLRGIYMGEELRSIATRFPDSKIAAIVGFGHLRDSEEIPAAFKDGAISVRVVACTAKGQQLIVGPFADTPFTIPALEGVFSAHPDSSCGYLDLTGLPATAHGIVVFPRPIVVPTPARPMRILGDAGPVSETTLIYSPVNNITTSAYVSYANAEMVEPRSTNWPKTNAEKIADCLASMVQDGGITQQQGMYLLPLLNAYAGNTGRHSLGGSIVEMSFNPNGQYFHFRVVDTFEYPYKPGAEYGPRERHHQVSIPTLQRHFGFIPDAPLDDLKSKLASIGPASNEPHLLARFIPYLLVGSQHPERLRIFDKMFEDLELQVYGRDHPVLGDPVIATLKTEDFRLSPLETSLFETASALRLVGARAYGMLGPREGPAGVKSWLRSWVEPSEVTAARETLRTFDGWPIHGSPVDLRRPGLSILLARAEMRQLSSSEALTQFQGLLDHLEKIERVVGAVETSTQFNQGKNYHRSEHMIDFMATLGNVRAQIESGLAILKPSVPAIAPRSAPN